MPKWILVLATLVATPWALLSAQLDYRNLDDERPVTTEDAYPVERYAVELMIPFAAERTAGADVLSFLPELMWGLAANTMLGAKVPLALADGADGIRVGGPRLFALYNFNTESPRLPALALRLDTSLPWGGDAGEAMTGTVTVIATRSWGVWRSHLNGSYTVAEAQRAPLLDPPVRWSASLAIDHTDWRHSLLWIGELRLAGALDGTTGWRGGVGARWQATPEVVFDAGVYRRLSALGPDLGLTLGLSRTFAFGSLMPGGGQ